MHNINYVEMEYGRLFYSHNEGFMVYGNLELIYSPNNDNKEIKFVAKDKEEMIDFICGNKWPEFMEEFLQLVVQDLTCFN